MPKLPSRDFGLIGLEKALKIDVVTNPLILKACFFS